MEDFYLASPHLLWHPLLASGTSVWALLDVACIWLVVQGGSVLTMHSHVTYCWRGGAAEWQRANSKMPCSISDVLCCHKY